MGETNIEKPIDKATAAQTNDAERDDRLDWYLASTRPRQELRAKDNLINQGIRAYLPLYSVEKIRKGRKILIDEPMFTGYVFINISPEDELWRKVKSTRGIKDWVKFCGNVAKMPARLVESLIEAQKNNQTRVVQKRIKQGESVRFLDGPFEGLNGIFLDESGERRSIVLIEFLGSQNRINVANEQIISDH